ncbi:LysR family transcriptional regulator [Pseudoteredinibacter isoporae]|uniref:DNA-binding transcriptional LysR family regulator n=1 Tax=Pseudoteredinibacter isoporae TaxID=570281 RepID=A0A7X0JR16_9GAMM|nr:LysR family transcriptional regulator [Pseudoteredinibacter isoporae]MBB6520722.1 DNA-binding transcriptional LysR family regulator [Pseudoteredinibacter isoporae]NHO86289.1 LysR family transcriptional regulator [Pseudoteredinibacter isoporae]NIB25260.1 LysR family transcriptional regulator [Pseudoteredinibacter isoporae]
MNQLRHMSVFAHIVERGSITAAAAHLDLSKSVVSQHLSRLEQELGVSLLKRTTRQQVLTPAGKMFYESCQAINQQAEQAWQQARQALEAPQGRVRITAPDALMSTLVAPAIATTITLYPLLDIELISSDKRLAINADDIDLAIRVGESVASNLMQRRIGEFRDVLCQGKSVAGEKINEETVYVANTWQGATIQHQFVNPKSRKRMNYAPSKLCRVDSFHTAIALIQNGAGIGLIPDFLAQSSSGTICEAFPGFQLPANPVYALHPYGQLLPLGVSVCLEAIEQTLANSI